MENEARVVGTIEIDFDANNFSEDKLKVFEKAIDVWTGDLDIALYDMAEKCGFEITSLHPLRLDSLERSG